MVENSPNACSSEAKPLVEDKLSEFSASLIAAYDSGEILSALEEGPSGWQKWVKTFGKSLKRKVIFNSLALYNLSSHFLTHLLHIIYYSVEKSESPLPNFTTNGRENHFSCHYGCYSLGKFMALIWGPAWSYSIKRDRPVSLLLKSGS